ncbi:MAG: Lpp/OprI family alanine-zipper lipoprotein [Porticoccaceae bacterium]
MDRVDITLPALIGEDIVTRKTIIAAAIIAATGLAGCASNSELAQVRAAADKAQVSADRAQQTADAAKLSADQAAQSAAAASAQSAAAAKADSAEQTATSVNEKIERMFKKTMMK